MKASDIAPLPWKANSKGRLRGIVGGSIIWITDANGNEILHWSGFDASSLPAKKRLALAKMIVRVANTELTR